jgi:hypothetical protein
MEDLSHILFMGPFSEPPVKSTMFFNGEIHDESRAWALLRRAKMVIERQHSGRSRRCLYRKFLRCFQGYKFLLLWDYVTKKNYLMNYAVGYDRVFSAHGDATGEIRDRWGLPAAFWPYGYDAKMLYPISDCPVRYDVGFCGSLGERPGWEAHPVYSKR